MRLIRILVVALALLTFSAPVAAQDDTGQGIDERVSPE
jgi:hypothetical protein